ncbi:ABC transporter permease subunit [Thioalkalivibrio sp. ALMg13-2]|uniref:ABC transporter permease subunit n=1 Tax=Thioalkalivibrio sp. ALMg13-2 TaxID=1158167 RepID=UPI0003702445|nr:ABC transporter permease subunit [Thioalkalivibrio sp. ALMg13-2]
MSGLHAISTLGRFQRWRRAKDTSARYLIGFFGVAVVGALTLMFVYLLSETLPMFLGAEIEERTQYSAPGGADTGTIHLAVNRHRELAVRLTEDRRAIFFRPDSGEIVEEQTLPIPEDARVTSFTAAEPRTRLVAIGLDNGQVLAIEYEYNERFTPEGRAYDPGLVYSLGDETSSLLDVDGDGQPIEVVGIQRGSSGVRVAAATADGRLRLVNFEERTSMMTGEVEVRRSAHDLPALPDGATASRILLDISGRNMLVGDNQGQLHFYDISSPRNAERVDTQRVIHGEDAEVTSLEYLLGTVSVIVGGSDGSVAQYMLVRDDDNVNRITRVREFPRHADAVTNIQPEYIRKGFATADASGALAVHYPTSQRTLIQHQVGDTPLHRVYMDPRNRLLVAIDNDETWTLHRLSNPHPEVSLHVLWQKVWYEGRSSGDYVWQSSSATDEFEPKFSLVPLTLGTVKAAFYAMLFATPLAIMGAIYSAYFMSSRMRSLTKPSIELMEALPTVILGFLAGLWLAPYIESNLPAVASILVLMPLMMLVVAFVWTRLLPDGVRRVIPAGWEAAVLIPVVILVGWFSASMSPLIEVWLFNGDARQWLTDAGYTYDQRNALVIGIAMGFAVIPTIYSISEDAVFNVPKHLTQGSLALGATPWQTVVRVVLLTASPGIFSAVMIGFGRAVGETMIVLMATGNSPVVNFNIFEGMRTLSANIAVEMPETAVGGTHYRILFLAALVLFALTFLVNTVAEIVRQRLRNKYSSL